MSTLPLSRSADLQRLREEGYDIEIRSDLLIMRHVPYVTAAGTVEYAMLISELSTTGSSTTTPANHVAMFTGSIPHDHQGRPLDEILHEREPRPLAEGITVQCSFSSKPAQGYPNYYAKMTAYANILGGFARAVQPGVTAQTFPPVRPDESESVFRYVDSATSRAGTGAVSAKLRGRVAIIGLGGTGGYLVDQVAKTPVDEIHLFDRDLFFTHNAFRAPGAASIDDLDEGVAKVEYFRRRYDPMHRRIIAHPYHVTAATVDELREMSFVFIAIDSGPAKQLIVEKLEEFGIPFIDVGMGLTQVGDTLRGTIRVTASTDARRDHVGKRVSFDDPEDDEYDRNIQIADLNMLNAALAVIKWKKLSGFYADLEGEYSITYTIDGNHLLNEDRAE